MNVNLPPKIRLTLYVIFGVGAILAAYLSNKGHIGPDEVELFSAISAFVFGLAAINTPTEVR